MYFNGLSRDGMNISVDGTDAANPDRPSTTDFGGQTQQNILSVEFIEEFKTSKGVFSAELGRASSGGVNVITKSGTNSFHGTVFEFLRNDKLDARNFFAVGKDRLRLNQFGATGGGPVVRLHAGRGAVLPAGVLQPHRPRDPVPQADARRTRSHRPPAGERCVGPRGVRAAAPGERVRKPAPQGSLVIGL